MRTREQVFEEPLKDKDGNILHSELKIMYGECPNSPDKLHFFNYVFGDNRACMSCGMQINPTTREVVDKAGAIYPFTPSDRLKIFEELVEIQRKNEEYFSSEKYQQDKAGLEVSISKKWADYKKRRKSH